MRLREDKKIFIHKGNIILQHCATHCNPFAQPAIHRNPNHYTLSQPTKRFTRCRSTDWMFSTWKRINNTHNCWWFGTCRMFSKQKSMLAQELFGSSWQAAFETSCNGFWIGYYDESLNVELSTCSWETLLSFPIVQDPTPVLCSHLQLQPTILETHCSALPTNLFLLRCFCSIITCCRVCIISALALTCVHNHKAYRVKMYARLWQ